MDEIRKYMKLHGLNITSLARLVNLDKSTVSRHLRGKGMGIGALKLYSSLGIPVEKIVKQAGKKKR